MKLSSLKLKDYYLLTKPGIIRGNLMTAAAAFLFASRGNIDISLLAQTLIGISLVIASACVFNNIIDRDIDSKMERTKKRALASGNVSVLSAFIYGLILCLLGFIVLLVYTNLLTAFFGFIALFFYVVLYGITKRRSVHGTLVGSVSGSMPIAAGYTAVSGQFDLIASILFLVLVFWQMPHFYSIAIFRLKDYKEAKLPVLPVKKSIKSTKIQIMFYITALLVAESCLYFYGYAGITYLIAVSFVTLSWFWLGWKGFISSDDTKWARKMFKFSLLVLLVFSLMISIDNILP